MRIVTLSERASLIRTKQDSYIVERVDKTSYLRQVIKVDGKHCKIIGMAQTMCGALQVIVDYENGAEELILV